MDGLLEMGFLYEVDFSIMIFERKQKYWWPFQQSWAVNGFPKVFIGLSRATLFRHTSMWMTLYLEETLKYHWNCTISDCDPLNYISSDLTQKRSRRFFYFQWTTKTTTNSLNWCFLGRFFMERKFSFILLCIKWLS